MGKLIRQLSYQLYRTCARRTLLVSIEATHEWSSEDHRDRPARVTPI